MGRHLDDDDGADFERGRHRLHTTGFLIFAAVCGLMLLIAMAILALKGQL